MKKSVEQLLMKITVVGLMLISTYTNCPINIAGSMGRVARYTLATRCKHLSTVVASLTHAQRMLDVGCGHGYTATVMAFAGGPQCHEDTIEEVPQHAALAELAFQERVFLGASLFSMGGDKTSFPS